MIVEEQEYTANLVVGSDMVVGEQEEQRPKEPKLSTPSLLMRTIPDYFSKKRERMSNPQ